MAIVYRVAKGSPLTNAEVDGNFSELDTLKANKAITVTGTNGLTGGGDLSADRTLALGTPSTLTVSSTNSASGSTHTHALNLSGRQIIAGNGLVGGGDLNSDRTLTIGTPSAPISVSSTNSVTSNSHNHELDLSGRVITSGAYLTGGGNLGSNLTLNVDATTSVVGNKVVARDSSGVIHANRFTSIYGDSSSISGAIAFRVNSSTDNYIRFCNNISNIRSFLQTPWWGTSISAGTGLNGGGSLQYNRTINLNTGYTAIGTYCWLYYYGTAIYPGSVYSGSGLYPASVFSGVVSAGGSASASVTRSSSTVPGSWRFMGYNQNSSTTNLGRFGLWVRV